mgnify:CR=1 FL=1|jgi:hypothetical protein|tara:strand:+ start:1111 stop:1935 length:825 start_codon:yes stop_codon:yes gene_type:complete
MIIKPDLIIAGAMKGGTTSIRVNFSRHLQMFMCNIHSKERMSQLLDDSYPYDEFDNATIKSKNGEMDFFNVDSNYYCGLNSYFKFFRKWPPHQKVVAECSPNYLYLDENPLTHYRIKAAVPDVKLIFALRDPIKRTFSHYNHVQQDKPYWGEKYIGKSFFESIENPWANRLVTRSLYSQNLKKYLELFDKEKIYLLTQEDTNANTRKEYNKICNWLGLDDFDVSQNFSRAHKREYKNELCDQSIEFLTNYYSDSVKELQDLFPELDYSKWFDYS